MKISYKNIVYFCIIILIFACNSYGQEPIDKSEVQSVNVDFNLDGYIDLVGGFHTDSSFITLFISKSENSILDTVTIEFLIGESRYQDAFCGTSIKIEIEKLNYDLEEIIEVEISGFFKSEDHFGVRLTDGMCDSFHFFWNHDLKQLQYWRL